MKELPRVVKPFYFFRCLRTFTYFLPDLSPPLVPNEKLPPPPNSRLPEARNGDGFCGAAMLGWVPNGQNLLLVGLMHQKRTQKRVGVDPNTKPGVVLPKTGCDEVAAAAERYGWMTQRVDAPLGALTEVDDPKERPDDEPNVEEGLIPKLEPELKGLATDAEDPKIELPEEKVAIAVNPKDENDADEEN
ncbi:hypothetical protein J1N35_039882 [Gossypium stocksii]|uniref:Uncharacterized protein n=1 Tax=Gossypium stocksii TaxID=47602 RepID=A0A9D3UD51_9ROSI|nr:hypothetical protein J1N35_039882 [Gossypium stocksii]